MCIISMVFDLKLDLYGKNNLQEKKEEIWLSIMTKAPTQTEKSKE